jgi:hypothetical protein
MAQTRSMAQMKSPVESLCTKRSPDSGSQGVFRRSGFEANGIERNIVDNFVKDTKILAEESTMFSNGTNPFNGSDEKGDSKRTDDIPFYTVGFKSAAPEYTWCP